MELFCKEGKGLMELFCKEGKEIQPGRQGVKGVVL